MIPFTLAEIIPQVKKILIFSTLIAQPIRSLHRTQDVKEEQILSQEFTNTEALLTTTPWDLHNPREFEKL